MQTVTNLSLKKIKDFVEPVNIERATNDEIVYKRIVLQMKKLYKTLPYVRIICLFLKALAEMDFTGKGYVTLQDFLGSKLVA